MASLPSSAASLESSRQKQDAALATLGLHRFRVPEDGNCLFRAVASQLKLDQNSYHVVLREAAASWMKSHVSDLMAAGLLDGLAEIAEAATDGKWCGQAALVALTNVLHVNMAVIQGGDQGPIDIQHFAPIDKATANEQSGVILAYLYNGHYDAVVHEPNAPNPDYASWAAQCRYNNAVSERVARKLNDEVDVGVQKTNFNAAQNTKVSTLQIDLQPAKIENKGDTDNASDVHYQRRLSVDNVKDTAVLKQSRFSILRPSKSEMIEGNFNTTEYNIRQRRSSSPGPVPRQSPFTSIRAALEKQRRRSSSSREGSEKYESSSRQFGSSTASSRSHSRDASPHKVYSQDSLRRSSSDRKSSLTSSSPTKKNFGVELRPSNKKITKQIELEEEYAPPRRLPPKQISLNKDYGRQTEPAQTRRSSEGNVKKPGVSPYASNKSSFGMDFRNKNKLDQAEFRRGRNSSKNVSSSDSASGNEPPKVAPKPYKKMHDITDMKEQSQQMLINQNGFVDENQFNGNSYEDSRLISNSPKGEQSRSNRRIRIEQSRHQRNQSSSEESSRRHRVRDSSKPQSMSPTPRRKVEDKQDKKQSRVARQARDEPLGYTPLRIRPSSADNKQTSTTNSERRTRHRHREGEENFPGFHKTRVRSRERRKSVESQRHKNYTEQAVSLANKYNIETANVVTTPTEPDTSLAKQRMPYVGLSPSSSRKVNVQVSTEDDDMLPHSMQHLDPVIKLKSPQLIRDVPISPVTSAASNYTISSLTSIPLSPLSPLHIAVPPSASAPHLSPGPISPLLYENNPSSPGIRRIVQASSSSTGGELSKDNFEIPLRVSPNPDVDGNKPVRRRSVVEIQPQQLQMPSASGGVKVHLINRANQDGRRQNSNKFFP